jgi:ubiquinone/menaquinone biosynthesis C-methylase UbiE
MPEEEQWRLDDADAHAEFYHKHFVPAVFAEWALLLVDAAGIAARQRVLDAACGTGVVACVAADHVAGHAAITGVDLSRNVLRVARRLRPDIDWQQGNTVSLPFADESFDVVLCQAALQFFPDQPAALREMRRVLSSGGRIAVQVPGAMPQAFGTTCDLLGKVAGDEVADAWRSFFTPDANDVLPQFAKAGFQSADLETRRITARYRSLEVFLNGHVAFLTGRRSDVDEVLALGRNKLELYCTASGAMHIPMEGYIITALKG